MATASDIRGIGYRNPVWPGLPLEAVSLAELRSRAPEAHFRRPRRPDFHHLLLCSRGTGGHRVDFRRLDLTPGTVLHIRPGQVHAFDWNDGLDGELLMFAPEALLAGLRPLPLLRLAGPSAAWIGDAFGGLLDEYRRTDGSARSCRMLQHLLAALLLRLEQLADPVPARPRGTVFELFEEALEQRFRETRSVAEYARRLGYSERTLARAAAEAAGATPKAVIAARVLLEAKRLLVNTELGIGRIAVHLGFSEPTNFTKFFRKGTGLSPEAFRQREG
jgi:AraC-like DNA-binding protein